MHMLWKPRTRESAVVGCWILLESYLMSSPHISTAKQPCKDSGLLCASCKVLRPHSINALPCSDFSSSRKKPLAWPKWKTFRTRIGLIIWSWKGYPRLIDKNLIHVQRSERHHRHHPRAGLESPVEFRDITCLVDKTITLSPKLRLITPACWSPSLAHWVPPQEFPSVTGDLQNRK